MMSRCYCTGVTRIIILSVLREPWPSISTSSRRGKKEIQRLYTYIHTFRIYKDLINLDFEPVCEKMLELVHPHAHIQKVKDTIYNPAGNISKSGSN